MTAELRILQPARNRDIVITDDGVTFNLPEDQQALPAARGAQLDAAGHLERVIGMLNDDAPVALTRIIGTIPPGHPLGLPATRPDGSPY